MKLVFQQKDVSISLVKDVKKKHIDSCKALTESVIETKLVKQGKR